MKKQAPIATNIATILIVLVALPLTAASKAPPATQPVYDVRSATTAPVIDGKLDDAAWADVDWTTPFVDLAGRADHPVRLETRCKLLWNRDHLYIAAELKTPDVWSTMTEHDSALFREDAFEVFIDPDGDGENYCELEINAQNVDWDLKLTKPYADGGKADSAFELTGLKSAVVVHGTLNQQSDVDRGWSIELGIPWAALAALDGKPIDPSMLTKTRINLIRVDHPNRGQASDGKKPATDYWAWSPASTFSTHVPKTWHPVRFSSQK